MTPSGATFLAQEIEEDAKRARNTTPDDATFVEPSPNLEEVSSAGDPNAADMTEVGAQGWSQPAHVAVPSVMKGRLAPNRMLGRRYQIVQLLGEGGMGAVYKAKDCELDRMVALKIIRPELSVNAQILARFKQELILARRITQKNVIRIFDLGEADGMKFITMEFVEGKDLSSLLKEKGRLSFEECADVIYQTCTALDAAHSEGVVHRDLKPQNIMIGAFGEVLVLDWGVAKILGGAPGAMQSGAPAAASGQRPPDAPLISATATQHGAVVGTPGYMAPEQERGEIDSQDKRTDVYALGAILRFLLDGRRSAADGAAADRAVYERIPRALRAIEAKAMAADPAARYTAAQELAQEIERFLDGVPVEAYPEGFLGLAVRRVSRYRAAIVLILAYLLMRLAFVFWSKR
jgi:eukaryotic-like serine/threonine-protein kinase